LQHQPGAAESFCHQGWPSVSAGVSFYGNAIIEGIKRAPLSLWGKLFK
jgi:hypothetical protein